MFGAIALVDGCWRRCGGVQVREARRTHRRVVRRTRSRQQASRPRRSRVPYVGQCATRRRRQQSLAGHGRQRNEQRLRPTVSGQTLARVHWPWGFVARTCSPRPQARAEFCKRLLDEREWSAQIEIVESVRRLGTGSGLSLSQLTRGPGWAP